jgi:hypothetical protein
VSLAGSEEAVTELAVKTCSFRLNKPDDVPLAMDGATIGKAERVAGTPFFSASDSTANGAALWKSDGTPEQIADVILLLLRNEGMTGDARQLRTCLPPLVPRSLPI